jgi:hypothetical protein
MRILGLAVILLGAIVVPGTASAQTGMGSARYAVEVVTRDRILHGRQNPLHVPTVRATAWIFLDAVNADSAGNTLSVYGQLRSATNGDSVSIRAGLDGRIRSIEGSLRTLPVSPLSAFLQGRDSSRVEGRVADLSGRLNLPATRVWDLVPSFHPARLEAGATWFDTLSLEATLGQYRQTLRGIRVSRIIRDTTIAGRQFWIVADSATVSSSEVLLDRERTLAADVLIERNASGTVRGRFIYDPSLKLHRARRDTTYLRGTATLIYPDARRFTTPLVVERSREWTLYDPGTYAQRQAQLRAEALASRSGGVVIVATSALEEKLTSGDTTVRDSLLTRWRNTTDADERASIYALLSRFMFRYPAFRTTLEAARIQSGDTAFIVQNAASTTTTDGPLTLAQIRTLLPVQPRQRYRL